MLFRITKAIPVSKEQSSEEVPEDLTGRVIHLNELEPEQLAIFYNQTNTDVVHTTSNVEVIDAYWDEENVIGIQAEKAIYRLARVGDGWGDHHKLQGAMEKASMLPHPTMAYVDNDVVYHLFYEPEHSGYHIVVRHPDGTVEPTEMVPSGKWVHVNHVLDAIPMGREARFSSCKDIRLTS